MSNEKSIVLFGAQTIRRSWYRNAWWFAVVDVVAALTDSLQPDGYIRDLRRRDAMLNQRWRKMIRMLPVNTQGGMQKINCADTESMLRIVQSIPSPKAEPLKLWLAKVGYERIQEIEDPTLAYERARKLYEQKGYDSDWIDKRLRSMVIRQQLTDEWKERGVISEKNYAILTAEISKATFGMTPTEYKQFKQLPRNAKENLRDHMTDLELIFTMLGEKVTTELSKQEQPAGMPENKKVAKCGGTVAGDVRKNTEKVLKKSVITRDNNLRLLDAKKKLQEQKA